MKSGAVVTNLTRAHYVQLDGLRGLAILLVIVYHFFLTLPGFQGPGVNPVLQLAQAGWMGVDLFFVLSGFLITNILIETRTTQHYFRNFIARRTLRIWPLYYVSLLVLLVLFPLVLHLAQHPVPENLHSMQHKQAWFWLYAANWLFAREQGFGATSGGYFWSLAVEEQFYLLWPLVVYLLSERALLRTSLSMLAASLVLRLILSHVGLDPNSLYVMTFTHLDGLAVGSSLAVCLRDPRLAGRVRRLMPAAALVGLLGVAVVRWMDGDYFYWGKAMATFGYSCVALTFGALLVYAIGGGKALGLDRFLASTFMTRTGKYSYALYVVHVPIAIVLEPEISHLLTPRIGTAATFLIFCAATFGTSWLTAVLSWNLFEKRVLALKRYFEYGGGTVKSAASSELSRS